MEGKTWIEVYGEELDSAKRKEILETAIQDEGLTPANELRKKLLESRYISGGRDRQIDCFIRGWMEMLFVKGNHRLVFGKRTLEKEKQKIREDLFLNIAAPYGEEGEKVLYEEYCNGARLFLNLCKDDRSYTSVLFGLGRMKDSSISKKIGRSFYTVAFEVPDRIGMTEELKVFRRALVDVYTAAYPDQKDLLSETASN